jgi:hypothetical protein
MKKPVKYDCYVCTAGEMQKLDSTNLKCGFLSITIEMAFAIDISPLVSSLNLPVCTEVGKSDKRNYLKSTGTSAPLIERRVHLFQYGLKHFSNLFY